MIAEADPAADCERLRLRLFFPENVRSPFIFLSLDSVQIPEKIQMPPSSAQFSVGNRLKPRFLLFSDDVLSMINPPGCIS